MTNEIIKTIRVLAGTDKPFVLGHRAKVATVNNDRTCNVKLLNNNLVVSNVRLQAVPGQTNGSYIKPAVGSWVVIMWLDEQTPVVVLTSEFEVMELGGSENEGIVKAPELKTQLEKSDTYLTTLKTATEAIAIALDALVPGTSAAFNTAMASQSVGNYSNIQNTKVKH